MPEDAQFQWVKRTIRSLYDSEFGGNHLADEMRGTLPAPVVDRGNQFLVVAFCSTSQGGGSTKLYPPEYLARVSYPGREIEWSKCQPRDFGLAGSPDEPLGKLDDIGRLSADEYRRLKDRYLELVALILDAGWLVGLNPGDPRRKNVAVELREVQEKLSEGALKGYYQHVRKDLERWLAAALTGP